VGGKLADVIHLEARASSPNTKKVCYQGFPGTSAVISSSADAKVNGKTTMFCFQTTQSGKAKYEKQESRTVWIVSDL
jgi:hypothetical protein